MTVFLLWPRFVEACGIWGALLLTLLAFLLVVSWGVMPLGLWLLYRKSRLLEQQVEELMLFKGELSRQQKVERLRRDKERTGALNRQQVGRVQRDEETPEEEYRQEKTEHVRRGKERPRRRR